MSLQSRPNDSGAGNFFWDLQLTNDSSVECTVEGYPAVSLVSANSCAPARWHPVGSSSNGERSTPAPRLRFRMSAWMHPEVPTWSLAPACRRQPPDGRVH
ncbi:MAG: DUF4232 domain-containing protein, partial [Cryobacterium sp.]|nr:DUF4232 domain-containing protein [Cryobacterium sp.]